jgi:D-threo-aldose 1-dehydrogenase
MSMGGRRPLSKLGFGAATIGNLYREVSEEVASQAVDAAWDAGIRYFDTAPHYGLGLSERRLGAALAHRPRSEFIISTKVGRLLVPSRGGGSDLTAGGYAVPADFRRQWDFSADGVKRSLESSLERLGLDRVDIVYLHDPDNHWEAAIGEAYPVLENLRAQGVVKQIGVGMNQWQMPARFVRDSDIDLVMLAGRYTLLERSALGELLPLCAKRGVRVVAVGVFNSGLMARTDVPEDAKYDYATASPLLIARARRIAAVCQRHGVDLPHAAIWFPFGHRAVAAVAVGLRTAEQVNQCAAWLKQPPSAELWDDLRTEGLLDAGVPVPAELRSTE